MVAKVNVDFDEFKRLYAEGLNDREIGQVLGFSKDASFRIRSKLGLPPNDTSCKKIVVDLDEFKRLHAEGMNDNEIAEALGFSSITARNIRKDLGLPLHSKKHSRINEAEFFVYYQQGKSTKEIATELHENYYYLYQWMRKRRYKVNSVNNIRKIRMQLSQQQPEQKRKHEKQHKNKLLHPTNLGETKKEISKSLTISIPKTLLDDFNEFVEKRGYLIYSEAVKDAIRKCISDDERMDDIKGHYAGTASIIYKHTKHDILDARVNLQHKYSHLIKFSVPIYFGLDGCLEIIVLDGDGEEIKELAKAMTALKGVKFSELKTVSLADNT